jgi:hypothetical protein
MTLIEFKKEFQTIYDSGSMGAPSLNDYEISFFLTQAIRNIVEEIYRNTETTEYIKRGMGPLIKEAVLPLENTEDYLPGTKVFEANLPSDLYFLLQENVKLKGISSHIEVVSDDLDELNVTIKNPFRKPSNKRVLRTEIGDKRVRLYASTTIDKYKVKYLKKYSPIILTDFTADPDLLGTETIDGKNKPSTTELPDFLHPKIVKQAVVLAVRSTRENNLQTQIEV